MPSKTSSPKPHPNESILTEALRVTGTTRQENYGHPLANHVRIADLWNGFLRAKVTGADGELVINPTVLEPADVAMMMILLKVARELHTPKRDNLTDGAGYFRCVSRIRGYEP